MDERDRFAVVVVADWRGRAAAETAVDAAGGRIAIRVDWDAVDEAARRAATAAVILVEAQGVDDDRLERALATLRGVRLATDCAMVVAIDEPQIDPVAAALLGGHAQVLVAPTVPERVAALILAARAHDGALLSDVHEGEAERLRILNEEVARIAAVLARLSTPEDDQRHRGGTIHDRRMTFTPAPAAASFAPIDPAAVRRTIRLRRLRDSFFGAGMFEDPAWDMMLDLFAAELEGVRVSVSSLCIAAAVPPTTALRWIGKMTDTGLLRRSPDPLDRRRAYMALSGEASANMARYFHAARQGDAIAAAR